MAKKKYTGEKRGAKPLPEGERKQRITIFVEQRIIDKLGGKTRCKYIAELAIDEEFHEFSIK